MKTSWFATLLAAGILFSATTLFAAMPQAGDTAPLFTGTDQNGKDFKLADLVGKKIVLLYFYPRSIGGKFLRESCEIFEKISKMI